MLIQNANVFLPDGRFHRLDVRFSERIEALAVPGAMTDDAALDGSDRYLIPGMVDIHTHGAVSFDFSDGTGADMPQLARHYARHGVTAFLATTMTLPEDTLTHAVRAIAAHRPGPNEARCAGVHLEGPFFSFAKRGAQNPDYLHAPDYEMLVRLNAACGGIVKLVAVAPELDGALPFIERASELCAVSLAHSAATYEQACAGFVHGATQATHLFNGMNELLHREPGLIGAAMDCGAYAELICDGKHNHPSAVRAAFAMFPGRVVLISDSLSCAGMADGTYLLGGQQITLRDGIATLPSGTIAGSRITVQEAVKNVVRFGIPLETAITAATATPAAAIRMSDTLGSIAVGRDADLALLDSALDPVAVFIGGRRYVEEA